MAVSRIPPTAAIRRPTARGVVPSQPRKETCTSWVFWAMKMMRRRSTSARATTATNAPLVRDRRSGSFAGGGADWGDGFGSRSVSGGGAGSAMTGQYPIGRGVRRRSAGADRLVDQLGQGVRRTRVGEVRDEAELHARGGDLLEQGQVARGVVARCRDQQDEPDRLGPGGERDRLGEGGPGGRRGGGGGGWGGGPPGAPPGGRPGRGPPGGGRAGRGRR